MPARPNQIYNSDNEVTGLDFNTCGIKATSIDTNGICLVSEIDNGCSLFHFRLDTLQGIVVFNCHYNTCHVYWDNHFRSDSTL